MTTRQFSFLQISLTFILSVGMVNHVLLIPQLMEVSGRDSWITVLLACVVFLPVFIIIGYIVKKTRHTGMHDWLLEHYGKWIAVPISVLTGLTLLSIIVVESKDMVIWTNSSYLPETPPWVLIVLFLALALYSALSGLKTVVITSGILLPVVILLGEFVMLANFSNKDYTLLLPVFEHGSGPAWRGVIYIGAGLLELIFFVYIQQFISGSVKKRYMIILGLVLAGLALGPTMGAIAAFGPVESALQRNPAFEQWRLVRIGSYIEHVDFLSIFQWISGAFIRVAFSLYIMMELLPSKGKRWFLTAIAAICAAAVIYPVGDIVFFNVLKSYYYPVLFSVLLLLTLVIFVLVRFAKPLKEVQA
ncbi:MULTISPECIES: GerAB/ArcD/ProY family transporter [Paenibacillus]|nr:MULTISPECIES: endospore germination permease [Paenibacillus]